MSEREQVWRGIMAGTSGVKVVFSSFVTERNVRLRGAGLVQKYCVRSGVRSGVRVWCESKV